MQTKILFTIVSVLMSVALQAGDSVADSSGTTQDEIRTLLRLKNIRAHGGYLGVGARYSVIDDKDAIEIGGRAAWITNHNLAIGLGGYGFFNDPQTDNFLITNEANTNEFSLQGGYGGLLIEPILFAKYPVHVAFPVLVGGGGVSYSEKINHSGREYDEANSFSKDAAFFVVNPGIELELNMLRFVRLAFGAYYRYTSPVDIEYKSYQGIKIAPNDALNGFSFGTTIKIGYF